MYFKTKKINPDWCDYDKKVAISHFHNYGYIYCDSKYHTPIDNEFELEEILKKEGK